MSIPVISLRDLASSSADSKREAAASLVQGLAEYGLAYVRDHSVSSDDVARMYGAFRELTDRKTSDKERLARPDLWFQRGWTPPNTEVAVAAGGQPDFKECYFAAPYPCSESRERMFPKLYPANIWPEPPVPDFQESLLAVGKALHETGLALLRGCAAGLGIPEETFTELVAEGAHVTRVLKYLALTPEQVNAKVLWGEEHTDFNLLTLLPGGVFYNPKGVRAPKPDDKSGLFLRTRATPDAPQGTQVRGTGPEGCITVQVGQELEILTGGRLHATPHVITAPGVSNWTRLSSAHFVHCDAAATLYPLAPFRTSQSEQAYGPPVLAGTYATKTLMDIGLAPKTEIDTFGYRHYDRLDEQRKK
jgi:isopenicillin N synthase-like dioxygenase